MEENGLEQYLILRRHYLPHGEDSVDDISAAVWLDNRHWEFMRIAVANGISTAFKGTE
ncbi:DUF6890 family protein [Yokenella regensburgei]|uniref:DUF6890 family protein n=1 Tax=Yokenella regensburgei TaxID=158877 RepID=UPI003B5154FB